MGYIYGCLLFASYCRLIRRGKGLFSQMFNLVSDCWLFTSIFLFHIEIPLQFRYFNSLTHWHSCHLSPFLLAVRGPPASRSASAEGHADSGDSRHAAGASLHCRGVAACSRYVTPLLHTRGDSCTILVCPWDTQQPVNRVQSWLWVPSTPFPLPFVRLTVDVGEKIVHGKKKKFL